MKVKVWSCSLSGKTNRSNDLSFFNDLPWFYADTVLSAKSSLAATTLPLATASTSTPYPYQFFIRLSSPLANRPWHTFPGIFPGLFGNAYHGILPGQVILVQRSNDG